MLSRAGWLYRKNRHPQELAYPDGTRATLRSDEFVKSLQGFVEDWWRRIRKRLVPTEPLEHEAFARAYRRFQQIKRRKIDPGRELADRGPAVPSSNKLRRDRYGKRWTMAGGSVGHQVGDLPESRPLNLVQTGRKLGKPENTGDPVDVMAIFERHHACREDLAEAFTHGYTQTDLEGARRSAFGLRTQQERARGAKEGPYHISVGRYRKDEVDRPDLRRAVTVPFVVAEIDGHSYRASRRVGQALLGLLEGRGADLDRITVAYSGHNSVHIRIPHHLLGRPIYRNEWVAERYLLAFFQELCRPDPEIRQKIDFSCLRPRHLIRAIGSVHPEGSRRAGRPRYCTGCTGAEFMRWPADLLVQYASGPYSPFTLPDPSKGPYCPGLADLLTSGISLREPIRPGHSSQGVIDRIRDGVEESESWGADLGRTDQGRNRAAFIYALHLLSRDGPPRGLEAAWRHIRRWNQRNEPPLLHRELRWCVRSASGYVET